MTKIIIICVSLGTVCGYFFIPDFFITEISGHLLIGGLCILLFFIGVDLGLNGSISRNFKDVGFGILVFPFAIMAGCLVFGLLASFLLPMSAKDSLAVVSGFGWYTLAPVILSDYSAEISAISFLHNIMREMLGLILIPITAKKIGYIEAAALPGAASMDVCLPVIEKTTNGVTVVYAFIMGVVFSAAVPILVPIIIRVS